MSGKPPDYVEVNERIVEFREKYPDGSLQSDIVPCPFDGFVIVKARAYRTPDDQRPGEGLAWEPVPGKTNFTRDSELMNAETSAWGRALIAVGAADAKRGIASANEVRGRQAEPKKPAAKPEPKRNAQQEAVKIAFSDLAPAEQEKVKASWVEADIPRDFTKLTDDQCATILGWIDNLSRALAPEEVPF